MTVFPTPPSTRPPSTTPDNLYLVVDLGGTQTRTAVFSPTGDMLSRHAIATPRDGGRAGIIEVILDQIRLATADHDAPLVAIGVSALGPVDPASGTIRTAPTLTDFDDVPLGPLLNEALDVPVHVINDANAATVAEWQLGAGRGLDNFTYVTVSTGIGCGIIANRQLITGRGGYAGEFGRVQIATPDGTWTRLEQISSGTAIAAAARAAVDLRATPTILSAFVPDHLTAGAVAKAAHAGDQVACDILATAGGTLGIQLANLVRLVDPQAIALGGGVILAGEVFLEPVRTSMATALDRDSIPAPPLVFAELGGDAGLHGAALALMSRYAPPESA